MKEKFPPKRILVPVDFSKPSLAALEVAKKLALDFGASLDSVYIENVPMSLMGFGAQGEDMGMSFLWEQMREFRQWREDKLRRLAGDFPAARLRVHVPISYKAAPDAILKFAATRGTDLVVMGTHGHAGAGRFVFGSATEAVVRHCATPVLTVHDDVSPNSFSRILVPYNMETYADGALLYALKLAKIKKAEVTVLLIAPGGMEAAKLKLRNHVDAVLGKRLGDGVKLEVEHGDPKRVILEQAQNAKFDLITLSAHRKPLLTSFTLGSTAENVLRLSPIPVLAVPSVEARIGPGESLDAGRKITRF